MKPKVEISLVQGDIFSIPCDVIVFKFARDHFGADLKAAHLLSRAGVNENSFKPNIGDYSLVASPPSNKSKYFLFVGTNPLGLIEYENLSEFVYISLKTLFELEPKLRVSIQHIALTIHGPGFGLDENEATMHLIKGCEQALSSGKYPSSLQKISFVESNVSRYDRLMKAIGYRFTSMSDHEYHSRRTHEYIHDRTSHKKFNLNYKSESFATKVNKKPHVSVAMPFSPSMEDVFYFGIQEPIHRFNYLCERVDQNPFQGDIMQRVRDRIETSEFVVADLTGENPNVYLEVGYAWGTGKRTILLCNKASAMRFDVQGQSCIVYNSIKHLETVLTKHISAIKLEE